MSIQSIILLVYIFLSETTNGSIIARYIRWSSGGSSSNPSTHFNEIQVMTNDNILALATVKLLYGEPENSTPNYVIDGNIYSYSGYGYNNHQYMTYSASLELDFGYIIEIKSINFWQYFEDGN